MPLTALHIHVEEYRKRVHGPDEREKRVTTKMKLLLSRRNFMAAVPAFMVFGASALVHAVDNEIVIVDGWVLKRSDLKKRLPILR